MSTARDMTVTERLFALPESPPLDLVRDTELPHIALATRARTFAPGEVIAAAGWPLRHLVITIEGTAEMDGVTLPRVYGEESLLFGNELTEPLRASAEGATCLLITRAHFFTIINECPSVLIGFLARHDSEKPGAVGTPEVPA
jgi:signal-transduction protein with cAMP-binding, CBS, and nucleotidyltransferase domain